MSSTLARDRSPGLLVFALSALFLGWRALEDVGFRDSGELGTAAFGLGVAHPTGFPGDLLLLRAASFLPFGHVAWRQNLCVALQAAAATGALASLCFALTRRLALGGALAGWLGAAVSVASLVGWRTFLGTALGVEVYSLALLCTLGVALGVERGDARGLGAASLLVGLSAGLHVTAAAYGALILACAVFRRGVRAALPALRVAAPLILCGALVVLYLPLASVRDPALDWGDPETLPRLFQHLTAARIRSAYVAEMLSLHAAGSRLVLQQFGELWPIAPLAGLGFVLGLRRWRLLALAPAGLLCLDLGYASFVNPMGAGDRQIGHVAGAAFALLAGLGVAGLAARARGRGAGSVAVLAVAGFAAFLAQRVPAGERADGYVAGELFGSGGPLAEVPPRSILLCQSDDACAGGLFALFVEAVRPDVDVAPAQHLWDPTVVRHLDGVGVLSRSKTQPAYADRAVAAARVLRALTQQNARPVLFGAPKASARSALQQLERLRWARGGRFRAPRAQIAWSQAYGEVGEQALASDLETAERLLRIAVELAPTRAVAHTNLGVALEQRGKLSEAVRQFQRALELEPERPTPWLNLARLQAQVGGPAAGLAVLAVAKEMGVDDPRLRALERRLRRGLGARR